MPTLLYLHQYKFNIHWQYQQCTATHAPPRSCTFTHRVKSRSVRPHKQSLQGEHDRGCCKKLCSANDPDHPDGLSCLKEDDHFFLQMIHIMQMDRPVAKSMVSTRFFAKYLDVPLSCIEDDQLQALKMMQMSQSLTLHIWVSQYFFFIYLFVSQKESSLENSLRSSGPSDDQYSSHILSFVSQP